MRVVVLVSAFFPEVNGGVNNMFRRVQHLNEAGHEVLLLVPDYTTSKFYAKEDAMRHLGRILPHVNVVPYPAKQLFLSLVMLPSPYCVSHMMDEIVQFKPDIIQVEGAERFIMGARELPGMSIAKTLRIPIVAFHHTNYRLVAEHYTREPGFGTALRYIPFLLPTMTMMIRWLYNNFDATFAPSRIAVNKLQSYGVSTVEHIRFTGIDSTRFNTSIPPSTDTRLNKLGSRLRLIHVGRIDWVKRLDLLIDALQLVERKLPGRVGLVIIGSGSVACEAVVNDNAENGNILFIPGFMPNELLGPYYRACDVAVLASAHETSPLVVMEAMSCGIPVIGASGGGTGELIKHNQTGLTFEEQTPDSLAEQIIKLASDEKLMASLRNNLKKEAEEFDIEAAARSVTKRLEKLVKDAKEDASTSLLHLRKQKKQLFDLDGFIIFFIFGMAVFIGGLAVFFVTQWNRLTAKRKRS